MVWMVANTCDATMAGNHTGHMVTEFENSFQACLAALTNEDHFNVHDPEEVKAGVEQTVAKFLDMAKQMECFFLQKRLLLSAQKPEQIVREDISDLKAELNRKEQLIQKHYDKIQFWQSLLSNLQGPGPRAPHLPNQSAPPPIAPPPTHSQAAPHQIVGTMPSPGPPAMPPNSGPNPMTMMQVSQAMSQVSQGQAVPTSMPPMAPSHYGPPPPQQPQMGPGPGMMPSPGQHPGMHTAGLHGPLAYLEKTTSNIGMSESRQ